MMIDLEPKLLPAVKVLLESNKGRWREISSETGVSYGTIQNIAQGRSENPSVNTVEKLHNFLNQGKEGAA